MATSFTSLVLSGILLAFIQLLVALPWLWAIDPNGFRRWIRNSTVLSYLGGGVLVVGLALGWFMSQYGDAEVLEKKIGYRFYGSVFHLQIALDFLVLLPRLLLFISPKTGAVALSAFRESIRQPMFWLIAFIATVLIIASMVIPYFTFGEDYKMMKQLGFDAVMLSAALFGLLASSIAINEEIEGRTAITVMSKPINRRQFLIGKYLGVLMGCWAMTLLLGWILNWALHTKPYFDRLDDVVDVMPIEAGNFLKPIFESVIPTPEGASVARGAAIWCGEALAHHVGLLLSFGQVMVLLAICVALATRMPFAVNLTFCLVVFLIGHLAPVLVQVTQKAGESGAILLVNFIAQLFNALFPALGYFDMGPAIIRDNQIPLVDFAYYVGTVLGYATLYSAIALIIGLILFEDRDLA